MEQLSGTKQNEKRLAEILWGAKSFSQISGKRDLIFLRVCFAMRLFFSRIFAVNFQGLVEVIEEMIKVFFSLAVLLTTVEWKKQSEICVMISLETTRKEKKEEKVTQFEYLMRHQARLLLRSFTCRNARWALSGEKSFRGLATLTLKVKVIAGAYTTAIHLTLKSLLMSQPHDKIKSRLPQVKN